VMKLLGRYSQQQGINSKSHCRLSNFSAETWCFLQKQFCDLFPECGGDEYGLSKRVRVHRVTESGLVVKAARVVSNCTIMRFETLVQLRRFCLVFGESVIAGLRCRLPKVASPKILHQNDIINVVCGSLGKEEPFNSRTVHDGIDLEFDSTSELFITVRYQRYAYTTPNVLSGCDPLLSSLIHRRNPYQVCGMFLLLLPMI
jgi:hypothetical protein